MVDPHLPQQTHQLPPLPKPDPPPYPTQIPPPPSPCQHPDPNLPTPLPSSLWNRKLGPAPGACSAPRPRL
jgi:hypothetical protein